MQVRYGANPEDAKKYDTAALRKEFLIDDLFKPGELSLTYSHSDRMIVGSAVPTGKAIELLAQDELRAKHFLERREAGIINISAADGKVHAGGKTYLLKTRDCLYLGRGVDKVSFESVDPKNPARFYICSAPAHTTYPTVQFALAEATPAKPGSAEEANKRTIYKYIHEDGIKSCQLVMGMTILEPGNIWNTMPSHTHDRRMETYLYFDMSADAVVFHFMGKPDETRHIVMRNEQAVISPSWSIHSGAGTRAYSFIWSMAGENQAFADMDAVAMKDLK